MKVFKPEEYVMPSSVDQVIGLLKEYKDKARIIAGGTTIHELSFRGMLGNARKLIDINKLGLSYVKLEGDSLRIGATTTFTELFDKLGSGWGTEFAALADALAAIRPIQVRNVATVGGSICASLPFFDLPTALLAVDAEIKVIGSSKERLIPISNFFLDFFLTDLKDGEFVTEIQIPRPPSNTSGAFLKLETNSVDWALINTAVRVSKDGNKMTDVRVALGGGVGRKVLRATNIEKALEGQVPSEEIIRKATEFVVQDVKPMSDFRASSEYRTEIAKIFVKRCLQTALSRIK